MNQCLFQIFAAFEETENEIIEAEEDDLDRLESVTSNDLNDPEDDSSMGQVLNFMKYMIQENQNLYEKILSFLQNYLVWTKSKVRRKFMVS